jgi:hypothetical protein
MLDRRVLLAIDARVAILVEVRVKLYQRLDRKFAEMIRG